MDSPLKEDSFAIDNLVSKEFFFNLLPSYIFLVTGLIRYVQLKKEIRRNAKIIKDIEDQTSETKTTGKRILPSYYVKRKFSLFIAFTYIIAVFLAFTLKNQFFWQAKFKFHSFLYIFGFLSWILSAVILEMEIETEHGQEIFAQRIFWPFSAVLLLVRILQSHEVDFK